MCAASVTDCSEQGAGAGAESCAGQTAEFGVRRWKQISGLAVLATRSCIRHVGSSSHCTQGAQAIRAIKAIKSIATVTAAEGWGRWG